MLDYYRSAVDPFRIAITALKFQTMAKDFSFCKSSSTLACRLFVRRRGVPRIDFVLRFYIYDFEGLAGGVELVQPTVIINGSI